MMNNLVRAPLGNCLAALLFLILGLASEALRAQESSELETIDVRGQVRREELQSTSATILENKDVADRITYMPVEMLRSVPGINLGFYGESGIGADVFVRGFTGAHGGSDVGMYMDGIPLHDNGHGDGYIDSGMIMPLEIESIEIIKGPASVYYGQHGAGASIPFQSIKGGNLTRFRLRYGSYNDIDASGLIAREGVNLAQVYAFQMFHGDGYRKHSEWDRKNFSARWTYKFTDDFSMSLNLRAYRAKWNSAGYSSYLRNRGDFFAAAVDDGTGAVNGGERTRFDARLWANYLINDESQLTFYLYGTDLENERLMMSDYLLGQDPTGKTGSDSVNYHKSWGTGLSYTFKGLLWGRAASAALGASYAYEKEDPKESYQYRWGTGKVRLTALPRSSQSFELKNPSFFGEFTYQVLDQLNVRLGLRYDVLYGTYNRHRTGGVDAPLHLKSNTLDFLSPKIGILYTPVDWVQIYANYGRGFSVPMLGAGDYSFFDTEKVFDLSARDQYELGARVYPTDWLDLELAGFIVKTTNDAFYSHVDWSMISNGATTRKGIEAAVNVRPLDNLYLSANYSYIIPKWDKRIDKDLNFKDHFIADLYQHMLNLEVGYAPPAGFGGRLSYHLESGGYTLDIPSVDINGVPVDGPHKAKLQKFDTLDLQLSYRFNDKYRLVFDVTNLLNKKYYGTGYKDYSYTPPGEDFLYTPRPPRLFYLTLEVNWDKS